MQIRNKCQVPTKANVILRWNRRLFFFIGILALGYVGFVLADAELYQAYYNWRFQQDLKALKPPVGSGEYLHLPSLPPTLVEADRGNVESLRMAKRDGSPLGRIEIEAIARTRSPGRSSPRARSR